MLKMTAVGINKLDRDIKRETRRQRKAHLTAIKVEGFRLRRLLKKEIQAGAPGGRRLAPLSMMRRIQRGSLTKSRRLAADKPLASLSKTVGYKVDYRPAFKVAVGFVESRASSVTWRRLAKMHQEGFAASVDAPYFNNQSTTTGQFLRGVGSRVDHKLFGKKKSRRRNVFFLRRSTRRLKTPARPIIDPFWRAHHDDAVRHIRRNFRLKLQGKRI